MHPNRNLVLILAQDITLRTLGTPVGTIPRILNTSAQNSGYDPSKNSFKHPHSHPPITIVGGEAKMVRPIERTILQRVGNVLLDPGLEILNLSVGHPGILKIADTET